MSLISWLFVPGDSEPKLSKAATSGADVLILDLEDSVALARKPAARGLVAASLRAPRQQQIYVRINPLATDMALPDLAAIMPAAPDGIVLPKPDSGADVEKLRPLPLHPDIDDPQPGGLRARALHIRMQLGPFLRLRPDEVFDQL